MEPLTPPECDLRNFPGMMVDVTRLLGSKFNLMATRNPLAWMVGHKLWYRAWHQVPAASLPDNDDELCQLAELGFDIRTWRKVKPVALHGWVKCSDGRLYHDTVAEVALEAWIDKLGQQLSSGFGNAKRHKASFDPSRLNEEIRRAATFLERLRPTSKRLKKPHVQKARAEAEKSPDAERYPDDLPPVLPVGMPPDAPVGSHLISSDRIHLAEEPNGSSSLSAREQARIDLRRMAVEVEQAAGDALASLAAAPGVANIGPLVGLLKASPPCDWFLDILPAVTSASAWHLARAGPGSMTAYTVAMRIAVENRDRRIDPPASKPEPRPTHERYRPASAAFDRRQANYARAEFTPAASPAEP